MSSSTVNQDVTELNIESQNTCSVHDRSLRGVTTAAESEFVSVDETVN